MMKMVVGKLNSGDDDDKDDCFEERDVDGALSDISIVFQASRNQSLESSGSSEREGEGEPGGKLCPMCEAQFAAGEEEAMEQHVMDHFVWDEDQDTMLYVGDEEPGSERL